MSGGSTDEGLLQTDRKGNKTKISFDLSGGIKEIRTKEGGQVQEKYPLAKRTSLSPHTTAL